jgi:hypothetical protein
MDQPRIFQRFSHLDGQINREYSEVYVATYTISYYRDSWPLGFFGTYAPLSGQLVTVENVLSEALRQFDLAFQDASFVASAPDLTLLSYNLRLSAIQGLMALGPVLAARDTDVDASILRFRYRCNLTDGFTTTRCMAP